MAQTVVAKQSHLCSVAVSDARHDFPTNFSESVRPTTLKQLTNTLPGSDTIGNGSCPIMSEDPLIESVIGLQRDANNIYITPQNMPTFMFGQYANAPTNYIKNYAKIYIPPENSPQSLDLLFKFGNTENSSISPDYYGVRNQAIYFIVDTKNSAFGEFLRNTNTRLSTNKAKYIYVQNRQTLYDPLDKVNLSTPSGKEIFYKSNQRGQQIINPSVQFAWEDTSPGMTKYVTYPNWASGQETLYRNFYSRHMLFQTLKGKPDEYKKHDTKVFMRLMSPTGAPTNNLVVFNKEIAQKTGGIMAALFSFGNDDQQIANNIIGNTNVRANITTLQNDHHYIAKRLGDQGQVLSACESKLRLRLQSDLQTIEQHQSNGKHCFVTFDRPALAFSLMTNVPMALFCYTNGGFDLYVHQKMNSQANMLLNNKDRYNGLLTSLALEQQINIGTMVSDQRILAEIRDKFIYNYNNKIIYTLGLINTWINDKTDYRTYIKRFLLISRYINILNSVDNKYIEILYNTLQQFNQIHQVVVETHNQVIARGAYQQETRYFEDMGKQLNEMYSEQIQSLEQFKSLIELGYNVLNDIYAPSLPYKPNDNMVDLSVANDIRANNMIDMALDINLQEINIGSNIRIRTFLSKIDVLTGSVFVKTILEAIYTLHLLYITGTPFTEQDSIEKSVLFLTNLARIVQTTPNISEDHQRVILEKLQSIQQSVYQSSNIPDLPLDSVYTIGPARSNQLAEYQLQQNNIYEYNMIGGLRKNTIVTPTLADYYKYDAYLRSWCIIMASIHVLEIKVNQHDKENSYNKLKNILSTKVMQFLFNDTGTGTKTQTQTSTSTKHFMKKYENQPIYYYDYFVDQIRQFPDLQKMYYDINRPYMENEIPSVTITPQMYKNVEYAFTQSITYVKNRIQQRTIIPNITNMPIYNKLNAQTRPSQIMVRGGLTRKHTRHNRKQRK